MSTLETKSVGRPRPVSPHLSVYRLTWTMTMSFIHRATGAALYVGTILLAAWLLSAASGKGAYDDAQWLFGSFLGRLVLFGYTWALLHHMLGGIRHFIWDTGNGYGSETRQMLAMGNFILSVALTLIIWVIGYIVR